MDRNNKNANLYYVLTAAALLLMGMVNMGQAIMQTLILPFIREDLGFSLGSASVMLTVRSACTVAATLLTDKIYNRFGLRKGILLSFACSIASAMVYATARNYAMCLFAIALSGFAFGLGGTIPAALVVRRWFVKRRGLVLGICAMSSGVTSLLLSVPVTKIVSQRGVFAAESSLAAVFALMAAIVLLLLKERPETVGLTAFGADEQVSPAASGKGKAQSFAPIDQSGLRLLCVAMVCCGFFTYCSWDNFNLAAIAAGYDAVFIGSVMAFNGLMNMVGKPMYGVVADAVGAPIANVIYYGLLIAAHACVVLLNGKAVLPVYLMVAGLGLGGFTISTVGAPIWVAELSDEKTYTATLKKLQTCCTVGGLCMSPFPGMLADAMGHYKAYYLFCAATTAASLILVNTVYRRQRKKAEAQACDT